MAAGLSQEALAERARISTEAVGALERGTRRAPQRQTLALLIDALALDGADRDALTEAAVRPALPRRRRAAHAPARASSAVRVPMPLTSFVGRDADLRDLLGALDEGRLISLVGTGGVGKSRLAFEAARHVSDRSGDGSVLVELAPIASGASVLPAFATALGVTDEGNAPLLDRLVAAQGVAQQLVVVDNCEHVLHEAAEVVYALLSRCPSLRIIATSREPLRVPGERISRIGPLAPDMAVHLFVDRAKAVAPSLVLDDIQREVVGAICRRVDCIPLAIELAASRADMLDLASILEHLQTRFEVLSTGMRTGLPYHRTLNALVDWSYELLDGEEQRLFRRFGAFAGSCRLDDAEAVLAFGDVAPETVIRTFASLHDKSLLEVERSQPVRFRLLQTIGDYARTRLRESGEAPELERRAARHYLDVAVAAGPALRGDGQRAAIARIGGDIDNMRAALDASTRDPSLREAGLQAAGALGFYWLRTGGLTEGAALLGTLTSQVPTPTAGWSAACAGGAYLELNRDRYELARNLAIRARDAAEACADEWLWINASIAYCSACSSIGIDNLDESRHLFERAERLGDPWLIACAAFDLGDAASTSGDAAAAVRYFTEALERSEATGDAFLIGTSSLYLGRALGGTEPVRAAACVAAAIDQFLPGALVARASCLESLSYLALVLQRPEHARDLLHVAYDYRRSAASTGRRDLVDQVSEACGMSFEAERSQRVTAASLADEREAIGAFLASI